MNPLAPLITMVAVGATLFAILQAGPDLYREFAPVIFEVITRALPG